MNNKNLLLLTALLFVGFIFGALYYFKRPKEFLITSSRTVTKLTPTKLIETNFQNYKIRVIEQDIFTLDFDNNIVYKIDSKGDVKKKTLIPGSKVAIPLIIDFDVDTGGTIRLADARNHEFIEIDEHGNIKVEKRGEKFSRAKYIGKGEFLCKTFDNTFENDEVLVLGKEKRQHIENILPKYNDGGMATDGFFVGNGTTYCHISYHMGDFIIWDKTYNKISRFNTIDKYNIPPKVIKSATGNFSLTGDFKNVNICGTANAENLYILSNVRSVLEQKSEFKSNNVVDVYSLNTGKYLKSYYLPKIEGDVIADMIIQANKLFTIQGKKIAVYDII